MIIEENRTNSDEWLRDGINAMSRARAFIQASTIKKIQYVENDRLPLKFGSETMSILLLKYEKQFLEIDEPWVENLLNKEKSVKGLQGCSYLVILLCFGDTDNVNFNSLMFRKLLNDHIDDIDIYNRTLLIWLCWKNPKLMKHEWARNLIMR